MKNYGQLLPAVRRKAFAGAAAAVAGSLLLAAPLFLAGPAQAAWNSSPGPASAAGTVLQADALPSPTATETLLQTTTQPQPSPTSTSTPVRTPAVVHAPAPTVAPTTRAPLPAPTTRAPAPVPTPAQVATAVQPTAVQPAPSTSAVPQQSTAAPASEAPWPTFDNTETASTLDSAGMGGTAGSDTSGPTAGANMALAGNGSTGHGMVWGILMVLGLTVVCGVAVGIYAMSKLAGRGGGAHRHAR
ncbi:MULTISPECIES: hypothetical protein [unclassified Arthrobacter]|uniref:hypothetical protein n=1 Tax=unclassified Arthrobacter TaxID=235627 RepID=UPI00159DC837|nr:MULTISPECIES: hypothetical protein [unclassified Arthrobacter]MCQ9166091.1 hypothetical protein [Arthrobacter sp. STN4]NVN00651.1 hypothetical protein [Arthrobacter sp. SDTb3-6]